MHSAPGCVRQDAVALDGPQLLVLILTIVAIRYSKKKEATRPVALADDDDDEEIDA